ncbi:hypothetical protein CJF25_00005, partial [Photobacterium phosphoreum]|nr:hypothetical protein [Photobacterium phosphoreum]
RFLQTLSLANNALAIRIIFPSVRVIQVSSNLTGLPASLGKQKSEHQARLIIDLSFMSYKTSNLFPIKNNFTRHARAHNVKALLEIINLIVVSNDWR